MQAASSIQVMVVEDFQTAKLTSSISKTASEDPNEVAKDGSTNSGSTGAVEPLVAISQVDSKTGEDAAGAETETDECGATITEEVAR
jgi:hypothetical protein